MKKKAEKIEECKQCSGTGVCATVELKDGRRYDFTCPCRKRGGCAR